MQEHILNLLSERSEYVSPTKIKPWDHQLALVKACLDKEKNFKKIALVDRPGAGKTNVVLGIVLAEKNIKKTRAMTTVIVVPHNILSQWVDAIKAFSNDLSFRVLDTYASVIDLQWSSDSMENLGCDIVLVNSLYFASISNSKCHRIVFDEVDSINDGIMSRSSGVVSDSTYYVSATTREKFSSTRGIPGVLMISCESDFLDASTALPEPIYRDIVLYNVIIDRVLNGVLSTHDIGALNAFAYGNMDLDSTANSIEDVVRILLGDAEKDATRSRVHVDELESESKKLFQKLQDIENEEARNNIRGAIERIRGEITKHRDIAAKHEDRIATIRERMKENSLCPVCYSEMTERVMMKCCRQVFCTPCIEAWRLRSETCPMCREVMKGVIDIRVMSDDEIKVENELLHEIKVENELLHEIKVENQDPTMPDLNASRDKISALESLISWRLESQSNVKIIVFSSFDDTFKRIREVFTRKDIPFAELDGGNASDLESSIKSFKDGRAKVLLVNAHFYCAGMNIEYATDVVLMHKMSDATRLQVVGRAQRPGRTAELRVFSILHTNEVNVYSAGHFIMGHP